MTTTISIHNQSFISHSFNLCPSLFTTLNLKGHFILGIRIKETQEVYNPIGGELEIGPKGITLGVETKACQKDSTPM